VTWGSIARETAAQTHEPCFATSWWPRQRPGMFPPVSFASAGWRLHDERTLTEPPRCRSSCLRRSYKRRPRQIDGTQRTAVLRHHRCPLRRRSTNDAIDGARFCREAFMRVGPLAADNAGADGGDRSAAGSDAAVFAVPGAYHHSIPSIPALPRCGRCSAMPTNAHKRDGSGRCSCVPMTMRHGTWHAETQKVPCPADDAFIRYFASDELQSATPRHRHRPSSIHLLQRYILSKI